MTVDKIMALADEYGARCIAIHNGARPIDGSKYRAALRAAVEQLCAENETGTNALMEALLKETNRAERAERECAELRKDAERYRWLRDNNEFNAPSVIVNVNIGHDWIAAYGEELDAAIDAAREWK